MRKRLIGWVVVASSVLALSCGGTETGSEVALRDAEPPIQTPPPTMNVPAPLPAAYCEVNVTGTGVIDLETEYLPNVVRCENGGANLEALKAQAIAARSVAYY
ncbi:MAG: SpoIID/LytB domain-containing protein, partial [Myxococcota bacterium]